MAVEIPISGDRVGRVDGFIDDLINVFADTPENCRMQPHVVPLAMHVTSRPHAGDKLEPIPRRPLLSQPKLLAEGSPAEVQIVLGWRIDTRRLRIELPDDKFLAWSRDLEKIMNRSGGPYHEVDSLVGRLNHASFVLPMARHFIGRLRGSLLPRLHKDQLVHLDQEAAEDLKLWKEILLRVHGGVSLNLVVTREPDRICWSDACPFGLGGYSTSGRAWRLKLPTGHPLRGHSGINNLLEFLAMVINVWLECLDSKSQDYPCILAIGDSTSAIGWLFKSSKLSSAKDNQYDAHLFVARKLAALLIDYDACLASQHIKGTMNVVADLLSFSGTSERGKPHPLAHDDPPNDELTQRFRDELTEQVPENFSISQLPREVLCFVTHALLIAASSLGVAASPDMKTLTESGVVGSDSADSAEMGPTLSSLCFPTTNGSFSPRHSSNATERQAGRPRATLPETVRSQWSRALCDKPLATWLRRFGAICGTAPCISRMEPTCAHSSAPCSRPSTTKTPCADDNERSHPNSSVRCLPERASRKS